MELKLTEINLNQLILTTGSLELKLKYNNILPYLNKYYPKTNNNKTIFNFNINNNNNNLTSFTSYNNNNITTTTTTTHNNSTNSTHNNNNTYSNNKYNNLDNNNNNNYYNYNDKIEWFINNNRYLNKNNLIIYFYNKDNYNLLYNLTLKIIQKYSSNSNSNLIECLREYLILTGSIILIENNNNNNSNFLNYYLEVFSKGIISSERNEYQDEEDYHLIIELCQCILSLNNSIKNGQEIQTLPAFFSTVRKFTNKKLKIFTPQQLSELYNTLRTNGPYVTPFYEEINNQYFYLITYPIFTSQCYIMYTTPNSITLTSSLLTEQYQSRNIYLTSFAIYLYSTDSTNNQENIEYFECIPLDYVHFIQLESQQNNSCELQSKGTIDKQYIPVIRFNIENNHVTLSFYSTIFIKLSNELIPQLENVIWKCNENEI